MLTLEPPFYEIEDTIVYRDHSVATQFYYAAPPPRIAGINGRPVFDLMVYSVELEHSVLSGTKIPDELGAGFLTMCAECEFSDEKRRGVLRKLSEITGLEESTISLYPIPYHKGTVSIIALDRFSAPAESTAEPAPARPLQGRPTFVENILGSGKPSLLGDLRCIFSLSLTQDGASFLQGLYEDGAVPVGIVYDLSFYGLRPALDVCIEANLSNIYNYFGGGLSFQYAWFKANIEAGLEYLKQRGDIKVKYIGQATGPEAEKSKELAMSLFKDRIVQELFRTTSPSDGTAAANAASNTITSGTSSNTGGSDSGTSMLNLTLRYKRQEELKEIKYTFSEQSPEERTHSPQGFLPLLLSSDELKDHIHLIDLKNQFFELLEVLVTGPTKQEFDDMGIREVTATLTYGEESDPVPPESATLVFRPDSTGDKTFAVKRKGRESLAYKVVHTYDFSRSSDGPEGDSFRYEVSPRSATGRSWLINPAADFGFLDVEVVPGKIHGDAREIDVDLAYETSDRSYKETGHFHFKPGDNTTKKMRWRVRTHGTEIVAYTAAYKFYFEDGAYEVAPHKFTEPLLRVDTPFTAERELRIKPVLETSQVEKITVELEYLDEANDYRRQKRIEMGPPFESMLVRWPVLDIDRRSVKYRVTVQETANVYEGDWMETDNTSIVVGQGHKIGSVQIQLIGPKLNELKIDALRVVIVPVPENGSGQTNDLLFMGEKISENVSLTLPPGAPLQYRYRTTVYRSDGTSVEYDWREESVKILIIQTRNL